MSTATLPDQADSLVAEMDDYHRVSVDAAARGDHRTAILAAWAADVRALQSLLWESGLGEAPEPEAELRAVAAAVGQGLGEFLAAAETTSRARDLVELARSAMANAFDPSVHDLLFARFRSLEHLDVMDVSLGEHVPSGADRLEGRTPEQRQADLRLAAGDSLAAAHALAEAGQVEPADRQLWQAALASFEACLIGLALGLGDHRLATVDLHWALAAGRLAAAADTPLPSASAMAPRLLSVLGPALRPTLAAEFAASGTWPS
jgi:hypothetical protein